MSAWMIRAGHGGVYAEDWLDKGKIGIGWDFGSKDIASMKREQIRATYLAEHPNESKTGWLPSSVRCTVSHTR